MKYLVYVEDGRPPKKFHSCLEAAKNEAKRLASIEPNKIVTVLQIVHEYKSQVIVHEHNRFSETDKKES